MNLEQARELLPWYAAGSLEPEEARQVEEQLENNKELARELAEWRLIHGAVSEVGDDEPEFRPQLIQEALQEIDALENDNVSSLAGARREREQKKKFRERLQWNVTPMFAKAALIGQLALIATLSVVVVDNRQVEQVSHTLAGTTTVVDQRPQLSVAFNEDTSEQALRLFLIEHDAEIIAGPTALGIYTVAIKPSQNTQSNLKAIEESELVRYAAPAVQ